MKILVVAATELEIPELLKLSEQVSEQKFVLSLGGNEVDTVITGVGMMQTAFCCGKMLSNSNYNYAVNAGICGSFKIELEIGSLIEISEESMADFGSEAGEDILDIYEMKLADPNDPPFFKGKLINNHTQTNLSKAKSVTVNRALGKQESINKVIRKYNPDVVNMEGAAFFYACLNENKAFSSIRSVSNLVESRNKNKWNIPLAVKNLNNFLLQFLEEMKN